MTKLFETLEKFELLHKLITEEKTGNPGYLAKRLGISRGKLYKLIEELKSQDVSISYSRLKESFTYDDSIELELRFSIKVIKNKTELININAGSSLFSFRTFFYTEE